MKKPIFIYSPAFEKYSYPADALFDTTRAVKTRELLVSLGLLNNDHVAEVVPFPADIAELQRFHSANYLCLLQQAAKGKLTRESRRMGFGTPDCPVFTDMFDYPRWACGATLTGAKQILCGKTDIAFNPSGGFHHARAEMASGFCYLNDLVLACMRFADSGKKVLYLDIDAHHGDGVIEAFYSTHQVMTVSLHESGKTLWPWTGFEDEVGEGSGIGFNVNIPLPLGIGDRVYLEAFNDVVIPLANAYRPDVFVLQLGMDALAGDALAHLELTNNAHAAIIEKLLSFKKPILATGGGGYHIENTIRGWALAWKIMSGQDNESDLTLGLGGVMLQSTEWSDGLRDRVLQRNRQHCKRIEETVQATVSALKSSVFKYHGL